MDNRPIVSGSHRGGSLGLRFLWLVRDLPFAQGSPALIVGAAQDGGVTNRYAVWLGLIDNAVIQGHGLRRGFVDAGIVEATVVQDGHGKNVRGDDAGWIRSDLNHGGGPQLVRHAALRDHGGDGRRTYQHKRCTGQEPASAI
jgi:hypothetical protein